MKYEKYNKYDYLGVPAFLLGTNVLTWLMFLTSLDIHELLKRLRL